MPKRGTPLRVGATLVVASLVAAICLASVEDDYSRWEADQSDRADRSVYPLERAYNEWEATQAHLADADMTRRVEADKAIKERLALNSQYARWEADKAARALDELTRKSTHRVQAADELSEAEENARIARQRRDTALEQDRDAAEQEAIDAENLRIAAEQNLKASQDAQARAKQNALDEARRKNEAEQQAIADRYAGAADQKAAAFVVTDVAERTVYATTAINVRSGPGTGYDVVGSLASGASVKVNGSANRWWRTVDGKFVAMSYTTETKPEPKPTPSETPNQPKEVKPKTETTPYAWTTYVANSNGQGAIDACLGGLSYNTQISNYIGKAYYAIHNHCKGVPILSLKMGDLVLVDGKGVYKVVDSRDVLQGDSTDAIAGISGSILMQTCYSTGKKMRVVGLVKV